MWRAFFMGLGIALLILGAESFAIEKAYVSPSLTRSAEAASPNGYPLPGLSQSKQQTHEFVPPDWLPWSLVSTGTVIILYSIMLPRRLGS